LHGGAVVDHCYASPWLLGRLHAGPLAGRLLLLVLFVLLLD
jgi:hypothetical protein